MLNDAACLKAVYIVCGYTDLRAGMDRLAAFLEAQTALRGLYGKGTDGSCYIRGFPEAIFSDRAIQRKCVS